MKINQLKDKKIAILGFGLEGKSSLSFLKKIGVNNITILDKMAIDKQYSDVYNCTSGEKYLDNLGDFDIIIKTPGVTPYNPKILPYKDKLTSQTEIFFSNYSGKVIGITATKGKSTTVSILNKTLIEAGFNSKLVGNIGNPVLDEIDILSGENHDYVVYEMSSYMLEGFSPKLEIGVLGNLFRCHIDWHNNDYDTYKEAKLNILKNATYKLTNINLKNYISESINNNSDITYFGKDGDSLYNDNKFIFNGELLFSDEDMILKGEHNRINVSSVIGVLSILSKQNKVELSSLCKVLKKVLSNFGTLDHRLEEIGVYNGITFVDDSISTTPDSTIEAIKTYDPNIGTILLGGFDYGFEFAEFAEKFKNYNVKNIVFFPDTGVDIKSELEKVGCELNYIETKSMKEAVKFAYKNSKDGEVVLLSCASPSFSMYKNYKERGNDFKTQVETFSNLLD